MVVALDATSEVLNNSEGEIFCHPQNVSYGTGGHLLKNCGIFTECLKTEYGTFVMNKVDIGSKNCSGKF